ncbi:MAG: F0F1 ATP synthase subunit delta [Tannerella sp.]|jgi:F-type H+-transporting ATPase subunit delta|nr:F0F1 ATP synthase subunit delta [Tannerella sp.]
MNEGLISKRYAKALYFHASDMGEETLLYHRMQILETLLRKMPDLRTTLKSPMIPTKHKVDLLKNATGKNAEQSYLDFIDLVVTNHRTDAVQMIALSYQKFYRQKKRINVVHLISARRLPRNALARIRYLAELKTHGKVEFSNRIDPSIDGGFIFQMNDIRIDASVKGQLDRINHRLAQMNKSII